MDERLNSCFLDRVAKRAVVVDYLRAHADVAGTKLAVDIERFTQVPQFQSRIFTPVS